MNATIAYRQVLAFITTERKQRDERAKRELWPNTAPVDEADEALTALEWLRQAASIPDLDRQPTHKQEQLF